MGALIRLTRPVAAVMVMSTLVALSACSSRESFTAKDFVGKWKSSRATTPVYMYANGEWELKTDDGAVLQYGVWQYRDGNILWSIKIDRRIGHDLNRVLSVKPREFKLREMDGSTTTFAKLD